MYDLNICACEFSIRVCYGCTRPAYYLRPHLPDTAKPDLSRSLDLTIAGIFGPAFKSNFPDTHHTTSILFCIYLIKIGSCKPPPLPCEWGSNTKHLVPPKEVFTG